jgi:hypothetical protein
MVKIPGMLKENEHYELIPGDNNHWGIRIKEGEYIESIISFGAIEIQKDDMLHFNFTLLSSPDPDLTADDINLQRHAGKILESVIMTNLDNAEE